MSYQQSTNNFEAASLARQSQATGSAQTVSSAASGQDKDKKADQNLAAMVNSFANAQLRGAGGNITNMASSVPTTNQVVSAPIGNQITMSPGQYFYTSEGQLVYAQPAYAPGAIAAGADINYNPYQGAMPFVPHAPFMGYTPYHPAVVPYTPAGRGSYWQDRQDQMVANRELPGLENRRGSYSTNESAPATPYFGNFQQLRDQGPRVALQDTSPVYSTPSPQQMGAHGASGYLYKTGKFSEIDALLMQHPIIPRAVPAVFTPRENMRTLEQSLINNIPGNRNVYIRGLHPNTDDETMVAYASRFGRVETTKAIIDTTTGACKGFGFAKYYDVRDSEKCIRGFYKLGYEVGFARESFNSRLKAEGDETSTNLYVSNLPKSMTESELGAIFMDYTVSSSRILRDNQGNSRGVGFARFESREICEEVIKTFHGQPIGDEGLLLQVRYADTPSQKDLKRITTERRHFRMTEYNVGAYGTAADVIALSPLSSHGPSPALGHRMAPLARHIPVTQSRATSMGSWKRDMSGPTNRTGSVHFKDVDRSVLKPSHIRSNIKKQEECSIATPDVSDDGDVGDDTIHGASPAKSVTVTLTSSTKV